MLLQGTGGGAAVAAPRPGPVKGIGIRLLEAPVVRRKDPRARVAVVDHLAPGTTIRRRFEVSNTTDRRQHIELYAAAASIQHDRFVFADGRAPNELTSWITVAPAALNLAPGTRRSARFTIAVPATAWKGERYGVIWAQVSSPPDRHHNIGMISRVGIRVYLDIGPGGEPPSDLRIEKLTPERLNDGRPRLIARVRNTGGRALDLSGRLVLSHGPGGVHAGPYPAATGVVLKPGEYGQEIFTLGRRLPDGPWRADVDVQSGMVKRHVGAEVTFPDKGVGVAVSAFTAVRPPWAVTILAAAVSLALGVARLLRRRRRSRPGRA